MRVAGRLSTAVALVAAAGGFALVQEPAITAQTPPTQPVSFTRDIRPILTDNCFACHGPDDKQRKAKLHFDTKEGAFGRPDVIVPGQAVRSHLIERVTNEDPDERMPPAESGKTLNARQIDLLRRWIDEGAKWETHWAYVKPVRSEVPTVKNATWVRNPIDAFIGARLEREGLMPSPEADKATLLRRVTYDLTGLPPSPAELDSFMADSSADAYERRVDALFKNPHYGERMAMPWLDAARYADSHGYHIDSLRDMWPWRDWVIGAFNKNMPFDEFTVEQLAGDLLPGATLDQKIASGFNRNHMINFEGGAIADEYQVEYVIDRVEATSTTWMGLTMGCARCHSHKFDPITQKEFYQFFGFFNTVPEKGLDGQTGNAEPVLPLPTPDQQAKLDDLTNAIRTREAGLAESEIGPLEAAWENTANDQPVSDNRAGLVAHYELDGNFSDISGSYRHGRSVAGDPTFSPGPVGKALTLDGETRVSFGNVGSFDRNNAFSIAAWVYGDHNLPMAVFQKLSDPETRRGYEWLLDDLTLVGIQKRAARLTIRLTSEWPKSAIQIKTRDRLRLAEWHQLTLTYDGSGKAAGLKLFENGKMIPVDVGQDNLAGSIRTDAVLDLGNAQIGKPFKGQVDDLRLYDRVLTSSEIEDLAIHYPIRTILSGVNGRRTKDESARVREYFLTYVAPDVYRVRHRELEELESRKATVESTITTTMMMSEMPHPRETFVLARGDYRNKTDKVQPGVPAILPALAKDAPRNRLTLARWLVSPEHPLTARVAVNRYWQMYFGFGIVKTQEDFGVQGEPPVHPELLDWLATEFVRTGWDVQAMQRLIVTSATYRQSSRVTPALLERDPDNRLLARGPRFRLPAEIIRDTALSASGLLNDRIGGPSVFPYQPKGLWEEMAFGDGFSMQEYHQSSGPDLYRRSMYTFWKRTVPPASLSTFDAPDREKCTARRLLTNTPLQALVLLNDPTYVEAARALAQRALLEGGKDVNGRIAYAFRLATGRTPAAQEVAVLRTLLSQELTAFRRHKKDAGDLLRVGESKPSPAIDAVDLAAWTTVASAVLNLDETVTKE